MSKLSKNSVLGVQMTRWTHRRLSPCSLLNCFPIYVFYVLPHPLAFFYGFWISSPIFLFLASPFYFFYYFLSNSPLSYSFVYSMYSFRRKPPFRTPKNLCLQKCFKMLIWILLSILQSPYCLNWTISEHVFQPTLHPGLSHIVYFVISTSSDFILASLSIYHIPFFIFASCFSHFVLSEFVYFLVPVLLIISLFLL